MKKEISKGTFIAEIAVIETMLIELMEYAAGKRTKEDLLECAESTRKVVKQTQEMATMALVHELAERFGDEETEK